MEDHDLQPLDIVLVQSGAVYGTENFTDQGVGLGARDYLSKPYEPQQLLLRVARLLIKNKAALR